ncbi:hypothetical protein GWO43_28770 [candidate division KSB1 bacterium]|nr:hypothetical protein [candidate division KSB1 bacterium]NIR71089.1 hypothetical protein [candidate division KSB1 bacterium]NIS27899.1 hypothetical protein [candidate division KSB1 bacterium]NIT74782.1 hypothetical protein [candidate division KSB1 bacterium]NIU28559.1 hypothetical protein [candidate division KSB1 bacterium]
MIKGYSRAGLPSSYYLYNGRIAEQVMNLISQKNGQLAEATIEKIREYVSEQEQEYLGEPTFAKAVAQLIDKIKTDPEDKINLILDTARITLLLKNLKAVDLN